MGTLTNPRHERFAQALFEGKTADQAYVKAGYSENRGNASRLKSNEIVSARLSELQSEAASNSKVTVESICRELDEANKVAKERGQAAAMVSASALRAKLAGLMVEKIEVGQPGSFDACESFADIADRMIDDVIEGFYPVDQKDRDNLTALIGRQMAELQDYITALKSRPLIAERVDSRQLSKPWQTLRPRSAPARLPGNGAAK